MSDSSEVLSSSSEDRLSKLKKYSVSHSSHELDCWVSKWTIDQVEKHLHIHYNAYYLSRPILVLQKLFCSDFAHFEEDEDLLDEQKIYIDKLKNYLHFSTVVDELFEGYNLERLRNTAREILQNAMKEPDVFVRSKLKSFIRSLERLLKEIEENRELYERSFTQFVADFAELCCLRPVHSKGNCTNNHLVWKNFRGMNQVIATPDISFFLEGTPDQFPPDIKVSVSEVKTDSELHSIRWNSDEKYSSPNRSCSYAKTKSRKKRKDSPHNTSFKESHLSDRMELKSIAQLSSGSSSETSLQESVEVKPEIASRLSKKILGSHVGELLFELHKNCKNVEGSLHKVPGLIIDRTKVFFTMLEISNTHWKKIEENHILDKEDRATVYYSGSFDILNENKRNILIKNFVRLNNLKHCSCHILMEESRLKD